MYTILIILFVLTAALMVVTILMQSSKGGGLASSFGGLGGSAVFGPRGAASFLQKATTILAVTYILLCLLISMIGRPSQAERESILQRELNKMQQTAPPASLPVAPMPEQEQQPQPGN